MRNRFIIVVAVVSRLAVKTQLVTGLTSPSPSPSRLPITNNNVNKATAAAEAGASVAVSTSTILQEPTTITTPLDAVLNITYNNTNNADILNNSEENDNNNGLEIKVIASIQNVASSASNITQNPKEFLSTLGDFGQSSGALISQKWLTPESLEECTLFWDDGFRILMRDLFRSYLFSQKSTRYSFRDWVALGWFSLLASSSSILFLPLLLPLIHVALKDVGEIGIDESTYIPPSFRSTRLAAMRRLRRPKEQPLSQYLANGTPRNVQEGISFFKDGTLLLVRDLKRGTLTSRKDDTWGSYGWFAFLAFSSFPITPLIIPLIDKRRNGENDVTSDYVPSSYRPERLKALTRLRVIEEVKFGTSPIDTLRAVANADKEDLPPPEMLLEAILKAQQRGIKQDKSFFLEKLAGFPGRRWELAYIAGKPAVVAMRKQLRKPDDKNISNGNDKKSNNSWYRPLERFLLPWTRLRDGLYIDSNLVSAIQNFDVQTMQNKNGVFQIFGSDFFQTTVEGPFSWDGDCRLNNDSNNQEVVEQADINPKRNKNAGICAFRPTKAMFQLGPWWKIEQDISEDAPFDQTHIRDLPFFKFIHVDDKVAVAMGRSGGIALWTRMAESSLEY